MWAEDGWRSRVWGSTLRRKVERQGIYGTSELLSVEDNMYSIFNWTDEKCIHVGIFTLQTNWHENMQTGKIYGVSSKDVQWLNLKIYQDHEVEQDIVTEEILSINSVKAIAEIESIPLADHKCLERFQHHAFICLWGLWYWQCGHRLGTVRSLLMWLFSVLTTQLQR